MSSKKVDSFAKFCEAHKIAGQNIKWKILGDKTVKISMDLKDVDDGGWGLVSMGLMFALRELGITVDITLRKNAKSLDIIVEK
jgi:hypothetical protein